MQHFNNILVGVDLSHGDRICNEQLNPPTLEAVKSAIWLANHLSAEVTFMAVLELSPQTQDLLDKTEDHHGDVLEVAQDVLDKLVAQAEQAGVRAKSKFAIGKDWLELIKQVVRGNHDLLIVGTRHASRTSRLLFGSAAMKLIRKCPSPVWVTKPADDSDEYRIMVPSDFTDVSQHALDIAVNGGQLTDTRLYLNHVLDVKGGWLWNKQLSEADLEQEKDNAEQKLREQLSKTDYRTLTYGVQVEVLVGKPEERIPQAIQENNIDLLVMGTLGRYGIPGMLIGNTTERLLPELTCSLLAIKPEGFESPVQVAD